MCMTKAMQLCVALDDFAVNPSVLTFRASSDYFREHLVDRCFKDFSAQDPPQRVRRMKILQWQNGARIGREPLDRVVFHRHGKNAEAIALQQKFRMDHPEQL